MVQSRPNPLLHLKISTDSHNSNYPHIMISQDLQNTYNYPQHIQKDSTRQQKANNDKKRNKYIATLVVRICNNFEEGSDIKCSAIFDRLTVCV